MMQNVKFVAIKKAVTDLIRGQTSTKRLTSQGT